MNSSRPTAPGMTLRTPMSSTTPSMTSPAVVPWPVYHFLVGPDSGKPGIATSSMRMYEGRWTRRRVGVEIGRAHV